MSTAVSDVSTSRGVPAAVPTSAPGPAGVPRRAVAGIAALAAGHLAVDWCAGIWPVYKTIAHLDLGVAGVIAAASSFVGSGLQIGFGILGDRGWSRVVMSAGILLAGAVMLVPYTTRYPLLFALVVTTSIGSAAFHPVGAGSAGSLSRSRTGLLVALFLAGGYLGYALSQLAFTAAYRATGGGTAFLALVPAAAAVAVWRFAPDLPGSVQSLRDWAGSLRSVWRPLGVLFTVQTFAATMNVTMIFLIPDLMLQRHTPTWMVEGGGHFAFVFGGALALVPAGHTADRVGGRRVLVIGNVVTVFLLAGVLGLNLPPVALALALAAFGALNSANSVVALSEGNRLLPGQNSALSALLMGLPWCVAALGPAVGGILADPHRGGTPARALAWIGLSIPAAILAATRLPRRTAAAAA